jgi:hypothetical protein
MPSPLVCRIAFLSIYSVARGCQLALSDELVDCWVARAGQGDEHRDRPVMFGDDHGLPRRGLMDNLGGVARYFSYSDRRCHNKMLAHEP